jgi:hypothetical protein
LRKTRNRSRRRYEFFPALVLSFVIAALSGCSRGSQPVIQRVAIIPGNILISDPATAWMRMGVALVFAEDFMTTQQFVPVIADGESGAYRAGAARILEATVEERGGRLRMQVVVRNMTSQKNESVRTAEAAVAGGLIADADSIAKRIDAQCTAYSTKNDQALQAFTEAAAAGNSKERIDGLKRAIGIDPEYGAAYVTLISDLSRAGQDTAGAIAQARVHAQGFTALDRARLNDIAARIGHAPLNIQVQAAAELLKLAPNNLDALTTLGSDEFLQANGAALSLFSRALEIAPRDPAIEMELAQGLLEIRRFAQAEKVFTALDSDPAVLPDVAVAVLLQGNRPRADSLFSVYMRRAEEARDPLAPLAQAGWIAISSGIRQGIASLTPGSISQPEIRSLAWSQLAVWEAAARDTRAAKISAKQASEASKSPITRVFSIAAGLVADAADEPPDQWRMRVNASPLDGGTKRVLLGYGYFLAGHYNRAAGVWQTVLDESGNTDLRARAMLASSLDHAGRKASAAKIRVQPFLPNLTGGDPYAAIPFREMRRLLGAQQ